MKKVLAVLLAVLMTSSMLSACTSNQQSGNSAESVSTSTEIIEAVYPANNSVVKIHTERQKSGLEKSDSVMFFYARGKKEQSRPEPVEFKWKSSIQNDNSEYVLNISENENMAESVSYYSSTESLDVYNLKIDTTYYWTVTLNGTTGSVNEFTVDSACPRNLYVDGVTNVRDIGGWNTENGLKVKQGLLFRCGRLNESSAETVNIEVTNAGKNVMLNDLKIKSEIDLRKADDGEIGGISSSPLGDTVAYYNCPMEWEGDMFADNREQILNVFSILSNEKNYPVIFHCNIGTDRTGMISFLVNALLGVPEYNLLRDYMFSNFADIGGSRKVSGVTESGYYKAVMNADGNSLSEKTYNALLQLGVPKSQLDSVIEILLEK
ncbi:MAG: tyrosine-protein phosphatase [Acetobacter sp.]|nr:tyrosine-protein phosphatase [Bacteroides sp.]MCM1341011.1 tyrosine-protein phosphatase [Acetobacter sp.]MCM1432433.1 tyrosine-protein phosphatase [Clostridiales bacterium]